jgi:hypothetical protein
MFVLASHQFPKDSILVYTLLICSASNCLQRVLQVGVTRVKGIVSHLAAGTVVSAVASKEASKVLLDAAHHAGEAITTRVRVVEHLLGRLRVVGRRGASPRRGAAHVGSSAVEIAARGVVGGGGRARSTAHVAGRRAHHVVAHHVAAVRGRGVRRSRHPRHTLIHLIHVAAGRRRRGGREGLTMIDNVVAAIGEAHALVITTLRVATAAHRGGAAVIPTEENTGNGGSDHLFTEHNAEVCFLKFFTSENF